MAPPERRMMRTCTWNENGKRCPKAATQHVVTSADASHEERWYFCDEHALAMLQQLADSLFTDAYLAYRIL
jgi:hypothetical protein